MRFWHWSLWDAACPYWQCYWWHSENPRLLCCWCQPETTSHLSFLGSAFIQGVPSSVHMTGSLPLLLTGAGPGKAASQGVSEVNLSGWEGAASRYCGHRGRTIPFSAQLSAINCLLLCPLSPIVHENFPSPRWCDFNTSHTSSHAIVLSLIVSELHSVTQ